MKRALYWIVEQIAKIHEKLLTLNDQYEYHFSDKQLHFLIVGFLGMIMIFVIHPIFHYLAKKNHVMMISWIYVFTLLIVLTFAIEIGQGFTKTGLMDFADIVYGLFGFLLMFAIFAMIRLLFQTIRKWISEKS